MKAKPKTPRGSPKRGRFGEVIEKKETERERERHRGRGPGKITKPIQHAK